MHNHSFSRYLQSTSSSYWIYPPVLTHPMHCLRGTTKSRSALQSYELLYPCDCTLRSFRRQTAASFKPLSECASSRSLITSTSSFLFERGIHDLTFVLVCEIQHETVCSTQVVPTIRSTLHCKSITSANMANPQ